MKTTAKKIARDENGKILILVLVLLVVGGLVLAPLLGLMSTGLVAGQVYEKKASELYAADAGVEDALHRILNSSSTLEGLLDKNGSYSYPLSGPVNAVSPVEITVTQLSLLAGLLDDGEYKIGQPHEDWITFSTPTESDRSDGYVEYHCVISLNYSGGGSRQIRKVGAFFYPSSSDGLGMPYDIDYSGAITDENLVDIVVERVSGGFHLVWVWETNAGPNFGKPKCNTTGSLAFKFRVQDPDWTHRLYFVWATVKEQDVSFVTNAPDFGRWVIESTAGNTELRSVVLKIGEQTEILTWNIT